MEQVQSDTRKHMPSSQVLADILDHAPPECFTLGWLMSKLQQRSFWHRSPGPWPARDDPNRLDGASHRARGGCAPNDRGSL